MKRISLLVAMALAGAGMKAIADAGRFDIRAEAGSVVADGVGDQVPRHGGGDGSMTREAGGFGVPAEQGFVGDHQIDGDRDLNVGGTLIRDARPLPDEGRGEFLLRGGTLTFDDFHGPIEWDNLEQEMKPQRIDDALQMRGRSTAEASDPGCARRFRTLNNARETPEFRDRKPVREAGGPGLEPELSGPKPEVLPITPPPSAGLSRADTTMPACLIPPS